MIRRAPSPLPRPAWRTVADAQTGVRRLTTIDALRQYPGFYHLQNVLVRGEFDRRHADVPAGDEQEIRVLLDEGVRTSKGVVDAAACSSTSAVSSRAIHESGLRAKVAMPTSGRGRVKS